MKIVHDNRSIVSKIWKETLPQEPLNSINPIKYFLINLKDRTDKLAHAMKQYEMLNVRPIVFEGIRPIDNGQFGSIGERGCYESHKSIWSEIAKAQNSVGLTVITEDDFLITSEFLELFPIYLKLFCDSAYDCMYLYDSFAWDLNEVALRDTQTFGTHFYVVKNSSISKFISISKYGPIDRVITDAATENKLHVCSTSKTLVKQNRAFETDIKSSGVCPNHTFTSDYSTLDNGNFPKELVGDWYYSKPSNQEVFTLNRDGVVKCNNSGGRWYVNGGILHIYFKNTLYWGKVNLNCGDTLYGVSWDNNEVEFKRIKR